MKGSEWISAAAGGVRSGAVWVVMATHGEWSDRTEWPIHARLTKEAAEADAASFTARCRAAQAQRPRYQDDTEEGWEKREKRWNRKVRKLERSVEDCGGEMEARFFVYEVAIADTSQPQPSTGMDPK